MFCDKMLGNEKKPNQIQEKLNSKSNIIQEDKSQVSSYISHEVMIDLLSRLNFEKSNKYYILLSLLDGFSHVFHIIPFSYFEPFLILLDPQSGQSLDIIQILLRIIYELVSYGDSNYYLEFFSQPHFLQLVYFYFENEFSLKILKHIIKLKPHYITLLPNLTERIISTKPSHNLIDFTTTVLFINPNAIDSNAFITFLFNIITNGTDTNLSISSMESLIQIIPQLPQFPIEIIQCLSNYIRPNLDDVEKYVLMHLLVVCIKGLGSFELLTKTPFLEIFFYALKKNDKYAFLLLTFNISVEPFVKMRDFHMLLLSILDKSSFKNRLIALNLICKLILFAPNEVLGFFLENNILEIFPLFFEGGSACIQLMLLKVVILLQQNKEFTFEQTLINCVLDLTISENEEISNLANAAVSNFSDD